MLFSNRRSIPYGFATRCPPFAEVARFVEVFGRALRVENHLSAQNYWSSFVGIWLLPRRTWYECLGYDERMIHMNSMETDMVLRLRNRHELVDLGRLTGYDFYHLEHYHRSGSLIWRRENDRTANAPIDLDGVRPLRYPGDVGWGLGDHELTLCKSSVATRARTDAVVRGRWLVPGLASVAGELTTHHLSTLAMFVDRHVGRVGKVLAERSPRLYHGLKKRLRL